MRDNVKIKLSKKQWREAGIKAGWIKEGQLGHEQMELGDEGGVPFSTREPRTSFDPNVIKNVLRSTPHMVLLHGAPGTGKSSWADVLASNFGFELKSVDFGSCFSSRWVGDAERCFINILTKIVNSKNTVFLIDEIDRPFVSDVSSHEVGMQMLKRLYDMFEDNEPQLVENNVFVVMTAYNIDQIPSPLRERANIFETTGPNLREKM